MGMTPFGTSLHHNEMLGKIRGDIRYSNTNHHQKGSPFYRLMDTLNESGLHVLEIARALSNIHVFMQCAHVCALHPVQFPKNSWSHWLGRMPKLSFERQGFEQQTPNSQLPTTLIISALIFVFYF